MGMLISLAGDLWAMSCLCRFHAGGELQVMHFSIDVFPAGGPVPDIAKLTLLVLRGIRYISPVAQIQPGLNRKIVWNVQLYKNGTIVAVHRKTGIADGIELFFLFRHLSVYDNF